MKFTFAMIAHLITRRYSVLLGIKALLNFVFRFATVTKNCFSNVRGNNEFSAMNSFLQKTGLLLYNNHFKILLLILAVLI